MNPVAALSPVVVITLLVLAGIGALALICAALRVPSSSNPPKPQTPTPIKPDDPIILPAAQPAPKFRGFNFLKPIYDFGERIPLNPGEEAHGDAENCSAPSHGIADNDTGPYDVKVRAFVKRAENGTVTLLQMPVYNEDTGENVSGRWIKTEQSPNGKWGWKRLVLYALGQKPWKQTGSLVNCGEFVPLIVTEPTSAAPRACGYMPVCGSGGTQTVNTAQVVEITVECAIRNRFGVEDAAWRQTILAATSPCGGQA